MMTIVPTPKDVLAPDLDLTLERIVKAIRNEVARGSLFGNLTFVETIHAPGREPWVMTLTCARVELGDSHLEQQ